MADRIKKATEKMEYWQVGNGPDLIYLMDGVHDVFVNCGEHLDTVYVHEDDLGEALLNCAGQMPDEEGRNEKQFKVMGDEYKAYIRLWWD